jgi:hypothetical protein
MENYCLCVAKFNSKLHLSSSHIPDLQLHPFAKDVLRNYAERVMRQLLTVSEEPSNYSLNFNFANTVCDISHYKKNK